MLVPLQNIRTWRPIVDALDQRASPRVVERALLSTGLSRRTIEGPPIFIPCALQAAFVENVARRIGEPHLGALTASQYAYADLGIYASYVLDASRLDIALERGVRALPFLQSGASVNLLDAGDNVVLQFGSGIQRVVGARQIDEGTMALLIDLVRNFVGRDWRPEWVELTKPPRSGDDSLDKVYRAPTRNGSQLPGIAIRKDMLQTLNPRPREVTNAVLFSDLRTMVRCGPPSGMAELVRETLVLVNDFGDFSEEAIALKLELGRRTLQRRLSAEGSRFRDVVASFQAERAEALLRETDHSVQEISSFLGYREVNSFRRAFRNRTGMTPTQYSAWIAAGKRT